VRGDLVVRRARPGETLLALDGKTYPLDETICVIADADGVESLSGIMGGENTGCSAATTDVLVESALWNPINISQTGRKLGINSDARYRFERSVDPAFMLPGLELATRMVMDLCGGTPSQVTVAGNAGITKHVIDFPPTEIKRLTGLAMRLADARQLSEIVELQNAHMREQMETFSKQLEELRELTVKAVKEGSRIASSAVQTPMNAQQNLYGN